MDYYIKSSDEQSLWSALEAAGLATKQYSAWDKDDNPVGDFEWRKADGYDLDIIGVIYKPTGEMLQGEDGPYPEMAALDGFHANLRVWGGELSDEQRAALPLIDKPNTPSRIWAGN